MTTERRFGEGILALVEGDITTIPADAIGNAANAALAGGGGVDGAIHAAGGPSILAELRARYPGGTPTGTAVASGAGDLPARWVIHAVGPVWSGGRRDEPRLLAEGVPICAPRCRGSWCANVDTSGDQRWHLRLPAQLGGGDRDQDRCRWLTFGRWTLSA